MRNLFTFFLLCSFILAKETTFKVSYDPNYAPFSYKQDGIEAGLFIDIWKLWAKYNNYTIEFIDGKTWEDAINLAKEEKVDFFLGTNSFESWMIASNFFYETKTTFFSLTESNIILEMKNHLNIGLIGSDYKEIILKEFPNSTITIFKDYKESIDALKNKEIELIYDDKLAIQYFSVQHNLFYLIKPLDNLIKKFKIHAITTTNEKAKIFNEGFIRIPTNELLNLERKWILNENEQYYKNFKQQITLTDDELNFIKNTKIKVSISDSWEPFSFKSTVNEPLGISSEYWHLISNKLNLKTQNEFFKTFAQELTSIQNKTSDLIYSAGETPQRKEYAIFTKEYANFPISIVTKKDENFIENISLIKDKKLAIGNNFTAYYIIKNKYPDMNFILVDSVKEGLNLVSKSKAYAYIDIQPVLFYTIAKYNFTNLKVSGNTGLNFSLKFMMRDDYPILESILNKAISSISINELNSIITKWDNVQFQTDFNYELFWQILFVIFIAFLAFLHRNYTLKNLNQSLTLRIEEKTKKLNDMNKNLENLVEKKSKELIQKEKILNHQSKMAAMGEMIENIAHQWRQPLSIISTAATGAKLKKDFDTLSDNDFYETMNIINNSAQHLSDTIDDFRNFFTNEKEASSFDVNIPIDKVLYLISSKLKNRNITIIKNTEIISISGLVNEFIQVLINIINNAVDAFEDNSCKEKMIFINLFKENNILILKIKDNAGGIKEDILDRVFEPYFTTKHKSQGTGIGLYMSTEIIKKHMNGNLTVSNQEYTYNNIKYNGAEFKIEIPIN
jgi:signal transduction histidine kinase